MTLSGVDRADWLLVPFATREELVEDYARELAHRALEAYGHGPGRFGEHLARCRMVARQSAKYVPHLYRGGWVIPGHGFSTERVGKYVPAEFAGVPEAVE